MGITKRLTAADGHELDAYVAQPEGRAAGGVVLLQEIFGVTKHIERVAEQYAAAGFKVVAPALFDRIARNLTLEYTEIKQGLQYKDRLAWPEILADVTAALAEARSAGAVAVIGYCWGGTVAHVAASDTDVDAAVSYYGGGVARLLDKEPHCPIMYHFGDRDGSIPPADVEKIAARYPAAVLHVYPGAGHGFNCDERPSFSGSDAKLAFARSVAFLREHLE